jgi:hypothetical protein
MRNESEKELECRFRQSITCHPVVGDVIAANMVVMKLIKKPRETPMTEDDEKSRHRLSQQEKSANFDISYELVGQITRTARFREMPDFQYHYTGDANLKAWAQTVHNLDFRGIDEMIKMSPFSRTPKSKVETLPIPPFFSRLRVPFDYKYKQCNSVKVVTEGNERKVKNVSKRAPKANWHTCSASDPTPSSPLADATTDEAKNILEHPVTIKLKQIFMTRPVWSRWRLMLQFADDEEVMVKQALSFVAYRFSSGPWRACWARLGYDPRVEPSAGEYQILDIRSKAIAPEGIRRALRILIEHYPLGPNITLSPSTDMIIIQMCDIREPMFCQLLKPSTLSYRSVSDPVGGWFQPGHLSALRALLVDHIRSISKYADKPSTSSGIPGIKLPWHLVTEEQRSASLQPYLDFARTEHSAESLRRTIPNVSLSSQSTSVTRKVNE